MRNQSNVSVQWFNVAKISGGKMYNFFKEKMYNELFIHATNSESQIKVKILDMLLSRITSSIK